MSYARTRAVELTSRNYRALGAVARQMGARLDAVRGAWAAACQARATELRKELEKVDLPCFQVLPPEPGSRLSPEKPGPETCPAPAGPNGVTIRVDARRLVIEAVPESVPDRKCTGQVPLGCFVSGVVSAPAFFDAVLLARKGNHEVLGQAGSTPMSIASLKELRLCGADGTPESDPSKTLALTP